MFHIYDAWLRNRFCFLFFSFSVFPWRISVQVELQNGTCKTERLQRIKALERFDSLEKISVINHYYALFYSTTQRHTWNTLLHYCCPEERASNRQRSIRQQSHSDWWQLVKAEKTAAWVHSAKLTTGLTSASEQLPAQSCKYTGGTYTPKAYVRQLHTHTKQSTGQWMSDLIHFPACLDCQQVT